MGSGTGQAEVVRRGLSAYVVSRKLVAHSVKLALALRVSASTDGLPVRRAERASVAQEARRPVESNRHQNARLHQPVAQLNPPNTVKSCNSWGIVPRLVMSLLSLKWRAWYRGAA